MAADGLLGNGVKVAYSASSPVSWIKVAQLMNVTIPGLEFDEVETTVHSSSGLRRYMPGLGDVTEMELELLADLDEATNVTQDALFDFQAARTTLYWRIEIPTARDQSRFTAFEFRGFVKNWTVDPPIDDAQKTMISVRFDGTYFNKYNAGASVIA